MKMERLKQLIEWLDNTPIDDKTVEPKRNEIVGYLCELAALKQDVPELKKRIDEIEADNRMIQWIEARGLHNTDDVIAKFEAWLEAESEGRLYPGDTVYVLYGKK